MLIINLWGGPGAGKTTTAAGLFTLLRHTWRTNTELVTEFATDLCFDQARANLRNQIYLLGNQYHRLWRLHEIGVEVVVTDAPLELNNVYAAMYHQPYQKELTALIEASLQSYDQVDILLNRNPMHQGGFKGGSHDRDQWTITHFDTLLSQHGPVMDLQLNYTDQSPFDILCWLREHSTVDGRIPYRYWKEDCDES